ncbi:MAG TPA: L-glutamate gamma-semialdehyde dehydrogenase [Firmicutes bacterium]|jgi:1-pyrroline-5-carboxylate dehydrogenase|nr:L-glutamate gamma-semialdehyde dehydrogenase [Bacillota bacterium]HHT43104.1 L-glutamate gamma-semialdehyde dehydrogenase [Bacillota bacterium]
MSNAIFKMPCPQNEPVLNYGPGSPEKAKLKAALEELKGKELDIPLIINGQEVRTGVTGDCVMPHNHGHRLAKFHQAGAAEVEAAIEAALKARKAWANMPWEQRAGIFMKAAEILAHEKRYLLNAATMLGVSKTPIQAEIDSACELIDFWRFNVHYMEEIYRQQPRSTPLSWNRVEHRGLEGFIFAVTPFNFTAIAGNLPTAPAMMGNTVVWKPASSAVYPAYFVMKVLEEAGLPPGVINFVPGPGSTVGDLVLKHPDLAGIHFTGSTEVFQNMWKTVGSNIHNYRSYPRIVGETGGKDFVFAHPSADLETLCVALVRGAFEFQGQKCSAASRAYIPRSIWPELKERLVAMTKELTVGDVTDFTNFMGAVIDAKAFKNITSYIEYAKNSPEAEIIVGGTYDDSVGYFINPTIVVTTNPRFKLMEEEIFGPVLTVYVYEDENLEETLELCNTTSPYGLTGSIFATDRTAIVAMSKALDEAAGNFYVNDKPTGAVVSQQPFGGARASGTNDKAGSMLNLQRWVSQRAIKENLLPPRCYRYPHLDEE